MNHHMAARQATRLFWGIVGSSLLVVSGVTLAWLLGSRHDLPMTVFEACVMMMRHFRGIVYHQVDGLSVMHVLGLVFMVSGVWAGGRHLMAWWRTRRFLTFHQDFFRRYRRGVGIEAVNSDDPRNWGRPPADELEEWLCRADLPATNALCDWLVDCGASTPPPAAVPGALRAVVCPAHG